MRDIAVKMILHGEQGCMHIDFNPEWPRSARRQIVRDWGSSLDVELPGLRLTAPRTHVTGSACMQTGGIKRRPAADVSVCLVLSIKFTISLNVERGIGVV
jgi:hypothetical protein